MKYWRLLNQALKENVIHEFGKFSEIEMTINIDGVEK